MSSNLLNVTLQVVAEEEKLITTISEWFLIASIKQIDKPDDDHIEW